MGLFLDFSFNVLQNVRNARTLQLPIVVASLNLSRDSDEAESN